MSDAAHLPLVSPRGSDARAQRIHAAEAGPREGHQAEGTAEAEAAAAAATTTTAAATMGLGFEWLY